jgi:hypothetical protein
MIKFHVYFIIAAFFPLHSTYNIAFPPQRPMPCEYVGKKYMLSSNIYMIDQMPEYALYHVQSSYTRYNTQDQPHYK